MTARSGEDPLAQLRQGFDAAAADFDALGPHLWQPIGAATVGATRPQPGDRVLDACCGTGASAVPAAHSVGPGGLVDAVDISTPMIEKLRGTAASLPQVRAHAADVLDWSGRDYDVVQSVLGIFFFPDMSAGTERLIQLARPGGRVGLTIWRGGAMEVAGEHLSRAIATVTGNQPAPRKPHLITMINQPEPYAAWLAQRGIVDVAVIVTSRRLALTDELAWLIIIGSGYRAGVADLRPTQVAAVRTCYLSSLRETEITEIDATTLIGVGTRP